MKNQMTAALIMLLAAAGVAAAAPEISGAVNVKKVSVYASGLPVQSVLSRLAKDAGVEILVDPAASASLDLAMTDVSVTEALDAICRATGLQWGSAPAEASGREVYLVRVRPAEPTPAVASNKPSAPAAPKAEPAAEPRNQPAAAKAEQPQKRPVDTKKAVEFLGRASRINIYSEELPPTPRVSGVRVGPPLVHPSYNYGYPTYNYPPPMYGGYWVLPRTGTYYYPVPPVLHNPGGFTSFGVSLNTGGLRMQYSQSRIIPGAIYVPGK